MSSAVKVQYNFLYIYMNIFTHIANTSVSIMPNHTGVGQTTN